MNEKSSTKTGHDRQDDDSAGSAVDNSNDVTEVGGRDGPDPTRYGDWEKNGRCIDF
ncbi:MAG: hypothetical protein Tsb002_31270 [Wenzhouxiangellaceae bacterium]